MWECELVQNFLNYLEYEKHSSRQTIKCYRADMSQFCEFLASRGSDDAGGTVEGDFSGQSEQGGVAVLSAKAAERKLLDVKADTVRSYLLSLEQSNYDKSTLCRKLVALRSFYKFLMKKGLVDRNPAKVVNSPRFEKKMPKILSHEDVLRLLETPSMDNWIGARDRSILETLYSTGIRIGELAMLNMEDVDFLGEAVHIRGRGHKERVVPIGLSALQAIQRYIELRNKRAENGGGFDTKALFCNKHGERLGIRSIRRKMDIYLAEAGMDVLSSPHTLRHSFAAHMVENGMDADHVRDVLGHRSTATTQVYVDFVSRKTAAPVLENELVT